MTTGQQLVDAAREYKGAPYRWWSGRFPEYGPPGYMDSDNIDNYTWGFVKSEGVHCAGLMNLAMADCGLDAVGLTRALEDYAWANGGTSFDPTTPGKPGALAIKGWTPGTVPGAAEGHVVMYTGEHSIIHAAPYCGVAEGEMDYDVHEWADFDVYFELPGVDYSGVIDAVVKHWNKCEAWYEENSKTVSFWIGNRKVG